MNKTSTVQRNVADQRTDREAVPVFSVWSVPAARVDVQAKAVLHLQCVRNSDVLSGQEWYPAVT